MKKYIIIAILILPIIFPNNNVYSQSALDTLKHTQKKALEKERQKKKHQDLMEIRISEIIDLFKEYIVELRRQGIKFGSIRDKDINFLYRSHSMEGIITKVSKEILDRKLILLLSYTKVRGVEMGHTSFLMFSPVGVGPISVRWKFYKDKSFQILLKKHGIGIGYKPNIKLFKGNDFTIEKAVIKYKSKIKENLTLILSGEDLEKVREKELEKVRLEQAEKEKKKLSGEAIKYRTECYQNGFKLFKQGKYQEALEQFDIAIRQNSYIIGEPINPINEKLYSAREETLKSIKREKSKFAAKKRENFYLEGLTYHKEKKITKALKKFKEARKLNSDIIGEPNNPTNEKLTAAINSASNAFDEQYEKQQKEKGLIKFDGKWVTPKEKSEILKERKKEYIEKNRKWALGVNYLGFSIKYPFQKFCIEPKAQFGKNILVIGIRPSYYFNRYSEMVLFLGVEAYYVSYKGEVSEGSGSVFGPFIGLECFISNKLSLQIDIGFVHIALSDKDYDVSISDYEINCNIGINFYFKSVKDIR